MDWFQWLSQTTLHPSLVYSYGVLFACNDLTLNDAAYFDHDFLLSMGVKVGKHRLEILKLARAETHHRTLSIKGFINSARRGLVRCAKKLASGGGGREKEPEGLSFGRKLSPLKVEWKEIREERKEEEEEKRSERSGKVGFDGSRFLRSPRLMAEPGERTAKSGPFGMKKATKGSSPDLGPRKYLSGPINGGKPVKAPSPRYSGPLDERRSFNKSPRLSGQLDGCYGPECHSPWAMLFEDLRPN